ncbi:hypothetical protein D3C71_2133470 [compost metagenome]
MLQYLPGRGQCFFGLFLVELQARAVAAEVADMLGEGGLHVDQVQFEVRVPGELADDVKQAALRTGRAVEGDEDS